MDNFKDYPSYCKKNNLRSISSISEIIALKTYEDIFKNVNKFSFEEANKVYKIF